MFTELVKGLPLKNIFPICLLFVFEQQKQNRLKFELAVARLDLVDSPAKLANLFWKSVSRRFERFSFSREVNLIKMCSKKVLLKSFSKTIFEL